MGKATDRSGTCAICGTFRITLHRDRILPGWKGGTYEPANVQRICANCHEDKTREDMKGHHFNVGRRHTPEAIAKMRGIKRSPETRERMRAARLARAPASTETREKIRATRIGQKASKETRAKMSLAHRGNHYALGYRHTEESREKMRSARLRRNNDV